MSAHARPEWVEAAGTPRTVLRAKRRIGAGCVMGGAALVLGTIAMTAAKINAGDAKRRKSARANNGPKIENAQNRQMGAACAPMPEDGSAKGVMLELRNAIDVEPVNAVETPCLELAVNPEPLATVELAALPTMPEPSTTLGYYAPIANEIDQTAKLMRTPTDCEPAEIEDVNPATTAEEPLPAPEETCHEVKISENTNESANPQRAPGQSWLMRVWDWVLRKLSTQNTKKRLRVCETVSLGEKRFVAVIQVDGEQFLVGGSSNSVSTLARLEYKNFADVYRAREQDLSRA